jgi:hypothetical protein
VPLSACASAQQYARQNILTAQRPSRATSPSKDIYRPPHRHQQPRDPPGSQSTLRSTHTDRNQRHQQPRDPQQHQHASGIRTRQRQPSSLRYTSLPRLNTHASSGPASYRDR